MRQSLTRTLAASVLLATVSMTPSPLRPQTPAATQAGQVAVPDSPAGRALKTWLEAFNSGDAAKLNAYYQRYEPTKSAEGVMGFREQTGGFDLLSVEKNEPNHVEFLVKEKKGDTRALGALDAATGEQGGV